MLKYLCTNRSLTLIERKTAKEILAESLKELSKTKPVDKITIKEIADNCGFSKRTFYHNFKDKNELILWEYSNSYKKVLSEENINLSYYEILHKLIMFVVDEYDYYKNVFSVWDNTDIPIKYILDYAQNSFIDFIKLKNNLTELTQEEIIYLKIYNNGIYIATVEWLKNAMPVSVEKLTQYYVNAVPEPIKKYLQ